GATLAAIIDPRHLVRIFHSGTPAIRRPCSHRHTTTFIQPARLLLCGSRSNHMVKKSTTEVRDPGGVGMLETGHGAVRGCMSWLGICVLVSLLSAAPSRALEPVPGETKALEDCDRRLCTILLKKDVKGDDLKCDLTKTWARSTIKGADSPGLTWGFGDARC